MRPVPIQIYLAHAGSGSQWLALRTIRCLSLDPSLFSSLTSVESLSAEINSAGRRELEFLP